jgi:DNA repair exonuclease SbcCD ATPase subunit
MQTILNQKDRTDAFFKFLFFFLVTVALVVAAVYINFKLPVQENRMLKSRNLAFEIQERNQELFVTTMNESIVLIDSLRNKNPPNYEQVEADLEQKLKELNAIQQTDQSVIGVLNKAIVRNLYHINKQQKDLREAQAALSKNAGDISELRQDLADAKAKLETVGIPNE